MRLHNTQFEAVCAESIDTETWKTKVTVRFQKKPKKVQKNHVKDFQQRSLLVQLSQ